MVLKRKNSPRRYRCAIAKQYICQVPGCDLDCGDLETLIRHMKRAHPGLKPVDADEILKTE